MLKRYIINGKEWQYEEGQQPAGAVEVKAAVEPPKKTRRPSANKTRKAVKDK